MNKGFFFGESFVFIVNNPRPAGVGTTLFFTPHRLDWPAFHSDPLLVKSPYQLLPTVVIRAPLHPVTTVLDLFSAATDPGQLTDWIRTFYAEKTNAAALYIASPSLYQELSDWLSRPDLPLGSNKQLALIRYAIRSVTRSTPFGMFAGLLLAQTAESSQVTLDGLGLKPINRLDSSALVQVFNRVLTDPTLRHALRFIVNNSIYQIQDQYRYSEFTDSSTTRHVQISSMQQDEYLDTLVSYAADYRSFTDLVEFMAQHAQVDLSEAIDYVEALIADKFLLSELEPNVTGSLYAERLRAFLLPHSADSDWITNLLAQPFTLTGLPGTDALMATDNWLRGQGIESTNAQSFWQTNLWHSAYQAQLSQTRLQAIGDQLQAVGGLFNGVSPHWVDTFKERFFQRYENRQIPLLTALDNESGIGLGRAADFLSSPSPLADALYGVIEPVTGSPVADALDTLRQKLLYRASRQQSIEVYLTDHDLPGPSTTLPPLFSALGMIVADSAAAIDTDCFQFVLQSLLSNPGALLGRFCHDSLPLTSFVRELLSFEAAAYPDAVLAEVVHLAGARSGNINVRPALRTYEIPYITPASVAEDYVISLSDLLVSVPNGKEIILVSKRLGKRVIPHLTTAHNVFHGDEVYQFLSGVARQAATMSGWSWKSLRNAPFLPRLRYKQLILSRAQWTIDEDFLADYPTAAQAWSAFRELYQLPRYLVQQAGDNELVLDTHVEVCRQMLVDQLRKNKRIKLIEWTQPPESCWVRDTNQQPYASETILFFAKSSLLSPVLPDSLSVIEQIGSPGNSVDALPRQFAPGSEWLYVKLYTGPQTADALLIRVLEPLLSELFTQNHLSIWFFLRYMDPEFHIRLRVRVPDAAQSWAVMQAITETLTPYRVDGYYNKLQIDTYEREIERYGVATIGLCEDYFFYDSQAVLSFLSLYPYADELDKLRFAFHAGLAMVTDFGFSEKEALGFFRQRQTAYQTEVGGTKHIRDTLNRLYRQYGPALLEVTADRSQNDPSHSPLSAILANRSGHTAPLITAIRSALLPGSQPPLSALVSSLLHMSMNRLFTSQLRLYELLTYHFICRHYESLIARAKDR